MQEKIINSKINDLMKDLAHFKAECKRLNELYQCERERANYNEKVAIKATKAYLVMKCRVKAGYYDQGQR
jgi:hypothetical protein